LRAWTPMRKEVNRNRVIETTGKHHLAGE
jgi:hypothetical protein